MASSWPHVSGLLEPHADWPVASQTLTELAKVLEVLAPWQ